MDLFEKTELAIEALRLATEDLRRANKLMLQVNRELRGERPKLEIVKDVKRQADTE